MQDLRQDLRQHQDYGDGGWRGGRGRGGGYPTGGRGGGGRGSSERVQQMRQESRASMRRRQIQDLDISGTMAAPQVLNERDAVFAAPHSAVAGTALTASFDLLPHEPRTIMHDAFHAKEPFISTAASQQSLDAGDLAVELETAMETCCSRDGDGGQLVRSRIGGKFVARPDQEEIVRKSISSSTAAPKR